MEEQEFIPTTTVKIIITHEEVQNIAQMNEDTAFDHIRIWYGIDSTRIINAQIISEPSMTPWLVLKLKQI